MITPSNELKYRRVLLKLSGEALMGEEAYGIDPKIIDVKFTEQKRYAVNIELYG